MRSLHDVGFLFPIRTMAANLYVQISSIIVGLRRFVEQILKMSLNLQIVLQKRVARDIPCLVFELVSVYVFETKKNIVFRQNTYV